MMNRDKISMFRMNLSNNNSFPNSPKYKNTSQSSKSKREWLCKLYKRSISIRKVNSTMTFLLSIRRQNRAKLHKLTTRHSLKSLSKTMY